MPKYYFKDNDDLCYTLEYHKEWMKGTNVKKLKLFEAERVTGEGYFYCSYYNEPGITGDSDCGKTCEGYKPRNGKNGRCKHSGHCYEPTDKYIILKS